MLANPFFSIDCFDMPISKHKMIDEMINTKASMPAIL